MQEEDAAFNINCLTSSKLMGIEAPGKSGKEGPSESMLKDSSFLCHILVECLLFSDYLKASGKSDNEGRTKEHDIITVYKARPCIEAKTL